LWKKAFKENITSIITGHNYVTEAILPACMRWSKLDVANIKDIHRKFSKTPLKTFPLLDFWTYTYYQKMRDFELFPLLNYMEYNKDEAKKIIIEKMGWRDYGGKHYESFFTKFYQGYVLKEKFGYDKRKAHLATLINSGQITKEEALQELKKPAYPPEDLEKDIEYFCKKMGFTREEFEQIMKEPEVPHTKYKSYETGLYRHHEKVMTTLRPITRLVKKII
ncbi:MAG: N-acetyl sugar amidotransferase, partial [Bacteroidetes bacterium]